MEHALLLFNHWSNHHNSPEIIFKYTQLFNQVFGYTLTLWYAHWLWSWAFFINYNTTIGSTLVFLQIDIGSLNYSTSHELKRFFARRVQRTCSFFNVPKLTFVILRLIEIGPCLFNSGWRVGRSIVSRRRFDDQGSYQSRWDYPKGKVFGAGFLEGKCLFISVLLHYSLRTMITQPSAFG